MDMPVQEKISQDSGSSVEFKLLSTELGNGQMQIAPDGLNFKRTSYNIVWNILTLEEKNLITDTLDATNGHEVLEWEPLGEGRIINFRLVGGYTWSVQGGDIYSVTCNVTEDFR